MTPTTLTLAALACINPSNTANNLATITLASPRQLQWIADILNGTLQDIYAAAQILYRGPLGGQLSAPASISVAVTNGSQTFTTGGAVVDGSTIVIDGDATFNQVHNEAGTKLLLYPYQGATGTQSATIYGDSILLDSSVGKVIGNVYLGDIRRLTKAVNRADLFNIIRQFPDYGRLFRATSMKPTIGVPSKYFVEAVLITGGATGQASQLRLRVNPLPQQVYPIRYDAKFHPPRLTVADLGTDSVPSTKTMVVPEDQHESLLLPLFLLKWAASPWFKNEEMKKSIAESAAPALARLETFRVQQECNRTLAATM